MSSKWRCKILRQHTNYFNFIYIPNDKVTIMGRSKRFRVSHVTSEGNRALARGNISEIKEGQNNKPPKKLAQRLHMS